MGGIPPAAHRARSRFVVALALVLAAGVLALLWPRESPAPLPNARPSIVLILTDDQRADTLSVMPTVRREVGTLGVTFEEAFVVNPVCCPSRASILTGRYSHATGVWQNGGEHGGFGSFDDASTLATWLHDAGYSTGLFGKYLNGYRSTYVAPGWDRWHGLQTVPRRFGYYFDYVVTEDGRAVRHGLGPEQYSTDVLAGAAARFIGESAGPVFVIYAPWAPHHVGGTLGAIPAPRHQGRFVRVPPWRPPSFDEPDVSDKPSYLQALPRLNPATVQALDAGRRADLESLLSVDEGVGMILDALQETGRLSTSLVLFTSDNGQSWGEHRWVGKQSVHEPDIRVPLVMRYDPLGVQGVVSDAPALNVDLAPTIAEVAGVEAPGAQGSSLVPLLEGQGAPWRSDFLVEHLDSGSDLSPPSYCAVRTNRHLYALYETGEEELYDLQEDPFQLENLAADPGAGALRDRLHDRLRELCDSPPPGFPEELLAP